MSTLGQAPAGFCPHCHYPIDPGVCSECGAPVSEHDLLRSLSHSKLAKRRRVFIVLAVLIMAGPSVYYGAGYVPWVSWTPTWILQSYQGNADHWTTQELARRFVNGRLSIADATEFAKKTVVTKLVAPTPFPLEDAYSFTVETTLDVSKSSGPVLIGETRDVGITVDNRDHGPVHGSASVMGPFSSSTVGHSVDGLTEGPHDMELTMLVCVRAQNSIPVTGVIPSVCFQRTLNASFVLDPKLEDRIKPECTAELTENVSRIAIEIGDRPFSTAPTNLMIFIETSNLSVPLAGRLMVYEAGGSSIIHEQTIDIDVGANRLSMLGPAAARTVPLVDVKYVPNKSSAAKSSKKLTRFYDCPIEWKSVPNRNVTTTTGPAYPSIP